MAVPFARSGRALNRHASMPGVLLHGQESTGLGGGRYWALAERAPDSAHTRHEDRVPWHVSGAQRKRIKRSRLELGVFGPPSARIAEAVTLANPSPTPPRVRDDSAPPREGTGPLVACLLDRGAQGVPRQPVRGGQSRGTDRDQHTDRGAGRLLAELPTEGSCGAMILHAFRTGQGPPSATAVLDRTTDELARIITEPKGLQNGYRFRCPYTQGGKRPGRSKGG